MKRHPTTPNNPSPAQTNIPLTPEYLDDPEKLILAARKHFAISFPNEGRTGCPASGVIRAARSGLPPDDELRSHLFHCSECFNEFTAAMRDHYRRIASGADRRTEPMVAPSRWRLPLMVGVAASLLLAMSLLLQRREPSASPQSAQTRSQPTPAASAGNPLTPLAWAAKQTAGAVEEKSRPAESLAINLDLNRFRALGDSFRGGSSRERKEEEKIKLPPMRVLLKLRLRDGSRKGVYRITIVDPNSNPLVETTARSPDGKSLNAELDLRRAARTAHRLRIELGDDLNEYLIEIASP